MEASINMRVFKAILLVMALAAMNVHADPLLHYSRDRDSRPNRNEAVEIKSKDKEPAIDHYDQRQNGTDNYRIKVDGLIFIMAPADALLAGAGFGPNLTTMFSDPNPNPNKPQLKPDKDDLLQLNNKPDKDEAPKYAQHAATRAGHKPALRISSLIAPFLNRIRLSQRLAPEA